MKLATSAALILFLVAATGAIGFGIWGSFGLNKHLIQAVDSYKDAGVKLNGKNGTIAETDKLLLALKSVTVHTDLVIAHEDKNLDAYDEAVGRIDNNISDLMGRGGLAVDAAAETARQGTATLQAAQTTIQAGQPLLASLTRTADASTLAVQHFDALIQSKDISEAIGHVNGMTGHGDAILGDAQKVSDKLTSDFLKPVPWWKWPIKEGNNLIDISAAVARHTP